VALVVVLVLSLGVLAGALVKLAGGSPAAKTQTTTVTTAAPATATTATQGAILPETTATSTARGALPGNGKAGNTTTKTLRSTGNDNTTGAAQSGTKSQFGVNLGRLKHSVAERLRKRGLGPNTEK
jgi:hypothetical protein